MFPLHQYTCQRYINKVPSLLILLHFLALFILILKSFNKRLKVFPKVRSRLPLFRNERVDTVLNPVLRQLLCTDGQMGVQIRPKYSQKAARFPRNDFCMPKRRDFLLRRASFSIRLKKYYFPNRLRNSTIIKRHPATATQRTLYPQRPAYGLSATAPCKIHPARWPFPSRMNYSAGRSPLLVITCTGAPRLLPLTCEHPCRVLWCKHRFMGRGCGKKEINTMCMRCLLSDYTAKSDPFFLLIHSISSIALGDAKLLLLHLFNLFNIGWMAKKT